MINKNQWNIWAGRTVLNSAELRERHEVNWGHLTEEPTLPTRLLQTASSKVQRLWPQMLHGLGPPVVSLIQMMLLLQEDVNPHCNWWWSIDSALHRSEWEERPILWWLFNDNRRLVTSCVLCCWVNWVDLKVVMQTRKKYLRRNTHRFVGAGFHVTEKDLFKWIKSHIKYFAKVLHKL